MPPKDSRKMAARAADRRSLEDAIEFYLRECFRARTAPRADDFARRLALARPYVSRRVARLIGAPLRQSFRNRQLAYAQRLLRTTPMPIEQIALASGFRSEWTFHRCFKAKFGVTPGVYRAAARQESADSDQ